MSLDRPPRLPERQESTEQSPVPSALSAVRELLCERFEVGPIEDRLPYHGIAHTEGVVRRALKIAEALGLSEHEQRLVEVAAAFHDTVQEWEEEVRANGEVKRKRMQVANELKSADEADAWMMQFPDEFSAEDRQIVRDAIAGTVPGWDAVLSTVMQPSLTKDTHPVVRAVALADLGSSGMEPDTFANEGAQLFAEENLDVMEYIRNVSSLEEIDLEVQKGYLGRYRTWMRMQIPFVKGREARIEHELEGLPPEKAEAVRALFSNFEESIAIANDNYTNAEQATFDEMARILEPTAFEVRKAA